MNLLSIINLIILTIDFILLLIYINKINTKEKVYKELIKSDKEMENTYKEYLKWREEDCKFYKENLEICKKIDKVIEEGTIKFIHLDFHTGRNKIIK